MIYVCRQLKMLFSLSGGEVVEVDGPTTEERRRFFTDLILHHAVRPPPTHRQAGKSSVQKCMHKSSLFLVLC